jgi:phosphatidylglycerophosphate synthase
MKAPSETAPAMATPSFKERTRRLAHLALDPVTSVLHKLHVGPDVMTVCGLLISITASVTFLFGRFRLGAVLMAASGVCDVLDGELARRAGRRSRFGAFLDSTLDRLSDGLVLAGIAGYYIIHLWALVLDPPAAVAEVTHGLEPIVWVNVALTAVLALVGSFMVSYTRARAEGLGLDGKVGWFERPERTVLLIVAASFGIGRWMSLALMLLAGLSFVTAAQRVVHIWKQTRGAGQDS